MIAAIVPVVSYPDTSEFQKQVARTNVRSIYCVVEGIQQPSDRQLI